MYAAPVRSRLWSFCLLVGCLAALAGCDLLHSADDGAGADAGLSTDAGSDPGGDGDGDAGFEPRPDGGWDDAGLVDPVGSEDTLDVATWNIENFPIGGDTVTLTAELIASLRLDLIAVQEIGDVDAFAELVDRLGAYGPYASILSDHQYGDGNYQKVGFLYRQDVVELSRTRMLFEGDGYFFPRPPMQVTVTVKGSAEALQFIAVTAHLKAGRDEEDRYRRTVAIERLEADMRQTIDGFDDEVILLGDLNDTVEEGAEVFAPFLGDPLYQLRTRALAERGGYSFVPSRVILDHVVTSAELADELSGGQVVIPDLDHELAGYVEDVSDHLPVVVTMPLN